jgi:two-component system nitrate/nitrite response regulator NarL
MSPIRVLIVCDVRLYSEGIRQFLSDDPDLAVIGTAASPLEALERVRHDMLDVVLLDQAMPRSLELLDALQGLEATARVITIGEPEPESSLLIWAEAGVAGFVPREATVEMLRETILSTVRGELRCSPRTAGLLLQELQQRARRPPLPGVLTAREAEILDLIDQSLSNKEIAVRLGIEVATVKNHVHNLLEKLHVRRRAEAAAHVRSRDSLARQSPARI